MRQWTYQHDELLLAVVMESPDVATVFWKGVSDGRSPAQFLNPIAQELSEKLRDAEVTVDLRQLQSMNSATVTPLINMIKLLDANAKLVRVMFLEVEWQRPHRNCMSAIARTLKSVRVECRLAP